MSNAIISGVIYKIQPQERYADFVKRIFWIQELNVKYPNTWQLEFWHDDVVLLDHFSVGELVECEVSIRGKIWENRYTRADSIITTLKCEKIKRIR